MPNIDGIFRNWNRDCKLDWSLLCLHYRRLSAPQEQLLCRLVTKVIVVYTVRYSILILDAEMQVVVIKVLQRSILSDASCWTPIRKTHLLVLMTMLCNLIFSLIKNTETFCDSDFGRGVAPNCICTFHLSVTMESVLRPEIPT